MKRKQEFYVAPTIKVVEIKVRHTLLAGSTPSGSSTEELVTEEDALFNE